MTDHLAVLRSALPLLRDGHFAAAAAAVAGLLAARPDDIEGLLVRGLSLGALGEADRAASDLLRIASLRPDAAHPLLDLLSILRPTGHLAAAGPVVRAALAQAPNDRSLAFAAAQIWLDLGEPAPALNLLDQLVRNDDVAQQAKALVLRGIVQCEANAFAAAIADFRAARALAPADTAALSNLGVTLATLHRFDEAIDCLNRACELARGDVRLQLNRAVTWLKAGQWARGLPAFETWRVRLPGRTPPHPRPLLQSVMQPPPPLLMPGDPINGQTLLLVHDEGLGDTIQYMRFVPLLAARGARVLVLVPDALARLAARLDGVAQVLTDAARLPHFDVFAPFPRLPMLFGARPGAVPTGTYLQADPALAAVWAARLPARVPGAGRRIGLVWAGQARVADAAALALDRHRSFALATLAPFATLANAQLVSLQMGRPAAEPPPPGLQLHDPMGAVRDFADTAAIVANLDAVVSADTSVVHLAGALGKPVLMLDRYDHCWRWTAGDSGTPADRTSWYSALRIYRQEEPGDWRTPVARAKAALDL